MNESVERIGLAATLDSANLGRLPGGELWRLGWRIVWTLARRCGSRIRDWQTRARDRRLMQGFTGRDHRDIGMTPSEARSERVKPFWRL